MIREPELTAARKLIAAAKKAREAARPKRVVPTHPNQRQPRKREPGFLAFLRRTSCAVGPVGCSGPTQAAHLRFGRPGAPTGLGIKPDDQFATGLCAFHHAEQHAAGNERRWWASKGFDDPHAVAARLYAEYLSDGGLSSAKTDADESNGMNQ